LKAVLCRRPSVALGGEANTSSSTDAFASRTYFQHPHSADPAAQQEQQRHPQQDYCNQGSRHNRKAKKESSNTPQQQECDESHEEDCDHKK